ncbi:nicotinamidase-related amidase [Neorhizobium sp. 2083]|nr:nicotinamidase-related amidase [Neorhizobium sp. 2083]
MTTTQLGLEMVDLVASLKALVPPARVLDKMTYSPWVNGKLHKTLLEDGIDTVVLSGGETDVCVQAAALGAVDLGYKVIVLKNAVCSRADGAHDDSLELLGARYLVQLEIIQTEAFLSVA